MVGAERFTCGQCLYQDKDVGRTYKSCPNCGFSVVSKERFGPAQQKKRKGDNNG